MSRGEELLNLDSPRSVALSSWKRRHLAARRRLQGPPVKDGDTRLQPSHYESSQRYPPLWMLLCTCPAERVMS